MIKRIALIFAVLVVVGLLFLALGRQAEPFPEDSESAYWLKPGGYEVRQNNFISTDASRPTQPHGEYGGNDSRKFDYSVWYPKSLTEKTHPLLVYSHGFSSMRTGGQYMARLMASHGYIVIATNYPSTNINAPGGSLVKDVVNQPGDVSFLIDQILDKNSESGRLLASAIDPKRIGTFGISLGGMTTTLVSYHPTKRDPRIKSAISIAGPASMFAKTFYQNADIPFMMIAGDIDALVSYKGNADVIPERVANSWLVTINGASHTGFADPARYLRWLDNPDSIGCRVVTEKLETEGEEENWYPLIGTPEQGVIYDSRTPLCEQEKLPSAMNPLRQHMYTAAAVRAFFTMTLSSQAEARLRAQRFLEQGLANENNDVTVSQSKL